MKVKTLMLLLVAMHLLGSAQNTITINTTLEKEPISKYVYGQFIEHLGKSVYGGLWAEMIQDRKFYFPVKAKYDPWGTGQPDSWWGGSEFQYLKASPWMILGDTSCISMDSITPFVGKYALQINPTGNESLCGIGHKGLALIADKTYTGYVIIKAEPYDLSVTVRLITANDTVFQVINPIDTVYTKFPVSFTAKESSDSAQMQIVASDSGTVIIGAVSLMPSDNIDGWRKDVVDLLKELQSPIYRWPGGNFVSGYNWRDGIGERDRRPTRENPAWTGIESNDVGIHEFMNLMKILNSEPFMALNMGLGTAEEAVAEVEYCNGDTTTVEGTARAANGQPEPFGIKYWAVGNEMYGSWQLGNMPIADYMVKHKLAVEGIWNVDSTAQIVAVGDVGFAWSEPMLTECGDYMNLLSEHRYCKEGNTVINHINALANEVKAMASAHRNYRSTVDGLEEKDIRIAFDEYNYWYGENPYGQLGIVFHQKDALGVAAAFHEMFKNSDLFYMANYAQTVNVLGCIKTTQTASALETTALPLILYRKYFGTIPVEVTGNTTSLNVSAAYNETLDTLTVAVINALDTDIYFKLNLYGSKPKQGYSEWVIANPDPMAYNEPGKEPVITIQETTNSESIDSILIPAYGLVMVKFGVEPYISDIKADNTEGSLINVYPNPAASNVSIEYSSSDKSIVKLSLINSIGYQVYGSMVNGQSNGVYHEDIDLTNFNTGLYFIQLETNNSIYTKKLILLK